MAEKILVTRNIPEAGLRLIEERFGPPVMEPWGRSPTEDELVAALPGCSALLCMLTDTITPRVLAASDRLKVVSNFAVGYNNINLRAAAERGIAVTFTPGVLTEATADLAFTLLLACARRVVEGDKITRTGQFTGWKPMQILGLDLFGKTLGIVGAGRIGQATARRARGFEMKIVYTSRTAKPDFESETGARRVALDELLTTSDFISLHPALTPQTNHLIGRAELAAMKSTAVLVNTARGAVIDEAALVEALQARTLFAAGLDVYEREPELHPGLCELDNVIVMPHFGSATVQARDGMATLAAQNLIAVLEGRRPAHRVETDGGK